MAMTTKAVTQEERMTYEQWKAAIMSDLKFTIAPARKRELINSQRGLWYDEQKYVAPEVVEAKLLSRITLCDVAFKEQYKLQAKKREAARFIKKLEKLSAMATA